VSTEIPMKKLFSNYLFNFFIILTLTLLGLWFALYDSYKTVFATVAAMPLWRVAIVVCLGLAPQLVYGGILTIMARSLNQKYPYRHGLVNALVGAFVSGVTPTAAGGQVAQTYTFRKQGMSATQGAGLIWMDFYINEVVFVIIALLLFVLKIADFKNPSITFVFGVALMVNVGIIAFLWIMVEYPKLYNTIFNWIITLLNKLRFIKRKDKIIDWWNKQMVHFHDAVEAVAGNKKLVLSVTAGMFVEFLALAAFVSMANTFVPLPGASGATESLFVLVYSTVIGKSGAASMMIFWRFATFYVPLLVGGVIFIRLKQSKRIATLEENDKDPD
jgi:uncharacterized protein (TIRG00374 family)